MEGQGENDELYPIAVLIDELKVQLLFHPRHLFPAHADSRVRRFL